MTDSQAFDAVQVHTETPDGEGSGLVADLPPSPSGQTTAPTPPPFPAPGWGSGDPAPDGYRWEWFEAEPRWRFGGDGKLCRFIVGADGPRRLSCKRPAVATLDRGRGPMAPNRWAYCEGHLYGRHLHDGAVWECRLVETAS